MIKQTLFYVLAILVTESTVYGQYQNQSQTQKKIVAVVPTLGETVDNGVKKAIQNALEEGIHKSGRYILVARGEAYQKAVEEIIFQLESGAVDDKQLKKFGHSTGADFVCYAQINKLSETFFHISYKLVNVESGEIPEVDSKSGNGVEGLLDAINAIALELFGKKNNSNGFHPAEPEMIKVVGGTFWMGCSKEQQSSCGSDENPVHSVMVNSFKISKHEITQTQWELIMGTTVRQQRDKANATLPLGDKGDNYPMYYVSWTEAQEFISRLNAATGKNYRLPTEAEWEYAARGGNQSQGYKYSGSNKLSEVAWFTDNSNNQTHTVGTKKANELDIHDMNGNVWEWCLDWYGNYSIPSQQNPTGASSGSNRVSRGGGWDNYANYCRVTTRSNRSPDYRGSDLGFRIVLP
jgi:formylglycine-generating enzyme required for sulfatase activity